MYKKKRISSRVLALALAMKSFIYPLLYLQCCDNLVYDPGFLSSHNDLIANGAVPDKLVELSPSEDPSQFSQGVDSNNVISST